MMYFIRKEKKKDYREVEQMLLNISNKNQKQYHYQICRLRGTKDFHKELTFVAENEEKIVGFISLVRATIMDNEKSTETLSLFGPFVEDAYQGQGVEDLLMKAAIGEAKFLGYTHIFAENGTKKLFDYDFISLENTRITDINGKTIKDGYVLWLSSHKEQDIEGQLKISPFLENVDEDEVSFYQEKLIENRKKEKDNKKMAKKMCLILSFVFTLIGLVMFILRMVNVISPILGMGSIIIAIGGCLLCIGASYLLRDRKVSGWMAIFLSLIILILGVISILG